WKPSIENADLAYKLWQKRIGTFVTSSIGRIFDAAANLVLGLNEASYEGHAPMILESLSSRDTEFINLPIRHDGDGVLRMDWEPMLDVLVDHTIAAGRRAAFLHECLAQAALRIALKLRENHKFDAVGLCGGVFQNRRLADRVVSLLQQADMQCYMPEVVPLNDEGLAFGQLIESHANWAVS
ncbi:MAG: carbamoyltransferase HypF, partial [Alphaproteobacteria bacterium]|nr:carbamoyltransferase HypF [Alphaproteobacteria bacterium]